MKSLAFIGCNYGADVVAAVNDHDVCWLFEPIEEVVAKLFAEFSTAKYSGKCIKLVNAAVYSDETCRPFRLYNVNGLSSSLGTVSAQMKRLYSDQPLDLIDERTVSCVRLQDVLPLWLTTLMIDAQGCDLEILKSIEPWLRDGRIGEIQAEADGDGAVMYDGLPDNSEESMLQFMAQFPHYECERVPDRVAWNPDFRWTKK